MHRGTDRRGCARAAASLHVPQISEAVDISDVPLQVIVPEVPEVQVVERVACVPVPQMVVPLVNVPMIGINSGIQQQNVEPLFMTREAQEDEETRGANHVVLYSRRPKLYRLRDSEGEKRGWSDAKLLLHKKNIEQFLFSCAMRRR